MPLLLLCGLSLAAAPSEISFEKYTLPNGMEVILQPDRRMPTVSVNIWYHVGAFNEAPGKSGLAHLFEHMMFQGSAHVADDAHLVTLEQIGGSSINATTDYDRTNYFETVPSSELETALWLESDRMGFLLDTLTDKKLDTQRAVVKNERRESVETAPYGEADEQLIHALFPKPHPYYGSVIGSMKDLEAASLDDVRDFFKRWYAPANATLAVGGDFDVAQAKAWIAHYFGALPSAPKPQRPTVAPAILEKEVVLHHAERVAKLSELVIAWHSPAFFAPGNAAGDLLGLILSDSRASRLEKRLVTDLRLAQSVRVTQESLQQQSIFEIRITARPGVSTEKLLSEVDLALEEIAQKGVSPLEVTRARNRIEITSLSGLQSIGGLNGKLDTLQTYNHYLGSPGHLADDLKRYAAVTPEDVQGFVTNWLQKDRRVVMHAIPAEAGTP